MRVIKKIVYASMALYVFVFFGRFMRIQPSTSQRMNSFECMSATATGYESVYLNGFRIVKDDTSEHVQRWSGIPTKLQPKIDTITDTRTDTAERETERGGESERKYAECDMAGGIRNHLVNRIDMFIVCHRRNYDEKYYFGWFSFSHSLTLAIASSYFIYIIIRVCARWNATSECWRRHTTHAKKYFTHN